MQEKLPFWQKKDLGMDITKEILDGLNEEHRNLKAKKEE